jgi:hypothetical protein
VQQQLWSDSVYLGSVRILLKLGNDDISPPSSDDDSDLSILARVRAKQRVKVVPDDEGGKVVTKHKKKSNFDDDVISEMDFSIGSTGMSYFLLIYI